MEPRSVLVVEDEPLLRELIASALESKGFVVFTAATAADAKRAFQSNDPDGLIIDVDLGMGPNGFDLADVLRRITPDVPILFLTNLPDPRFVDRDADGIPPGVSYLRKASVSDIDTLVEALDTTLRGVQGDDLRHDRDRRRPLGNLTRKQVAVLRLLADGKTNAQIAEARGTTIKAVEDTIHRISIVLGFDPKVNGNARVTIARRYLLTLTGRQEGSREGEDQ